MNVSATRLIYVNKGGAKIKNNETGEFVNEVPNGVVVEAGDLISIDGIAVESRGVGSSIIEIPSRVLDYPFLTNKMVMKFWYYLHHNYQYGCLLPILGLHTKTTSGLGYGYALATNIRVAQATTYTPKNKFQESVFAGNRFYIGAFADSVDDINNPTVFNTQADADDTINPSKTVFNFIECNKEISVNLGYDSPANIGSQITSDFHEGRFAPNMKLLRQGLGAIFAGSFPQEYIANRFLNPNTNVYLNYLMGATGDEDQSVALIRGIPWAYDAEITSSLAYYHSLYQGLLAVANPLYYYYGSRLLSQGTKINNLPMAGSGNDGDIYCYNDITNDGTNMTPQEGELLITNLEYNLENLLWLRGLIHSQKGISQGEKLTTKELRNQNIKNQYIWNIPIGRYDDTQASPFENKDPLTQYVNPTQTTKPSYIRTKVFYDKEFYEIAGYWDNTTGLAQYYELDPTYLVDGKNPKSLSEALDINVFCMKVPNTIVPPLTYDRSIAIPLYQFQPINNNLCNVGAFVVCDLTFSRPEATAMFLTNTQTRINGGMSYDNIMKAISIGAPDMEMIFDDQRGRFAMRNMYWANRIGNDANAGSGTNPINPDAEQECITTNKVEKDQYVPKDATTTTRIEVLYTRYALSGLGLVGLAVLDEEGNEYPIDRFDKADQELKFNNSLLNRLGFTYEGLINDYGDPLVMFQEQYYNTLNKINYTTFFPYPLTNNPLIDTTFNEGINTNDHGAPTFNLSTQRNKTNINIACESSYIYAENLPQKLASPYWIIASDIIDGIKFVKDGQPINSVAVCNRSYISGDFAFSFATDYKFKADIPFTISSIKTKVLTQDLLPADINDGTSIIYKIEKQYKREIEEEQQLEQKKKDTE